MTKDRVFPTKISPRVGRGTYFNAEGAEVFAKGAKVFLSDLCENLCDLCVEIRHSLGCGSAALRSSVVPTQSLAESFPRNFIANHKMPLLVSFVRAARFVKYFLPVILWMTLIFGGSTHLGAPRNTSRIIGPVLRWLNPNVTEETVGKIQFAIRKSGHVTEYGILCLLIWRALRHRRLVPSTGWNWSDARRAILISALYAASDEFHQSFVASREGSFRDVWLDTAGATAAIFLFWRIGRRFKRW